MTICLIKSCSFVLPCKLFMHDNLFVCVLLLSRFVFRTLDLMVLGVVGWCEGAG